jgi:hypothetical protein
MMVEADCNMAQAFEFPTVNQTTLPRHPKDRSLRSFPRGFPDPFSQIAVPSGTTLSCPIGRMNMGLWPARRKRARRPSGQPIPGPATGHKVNQSCPF